MCFIVLYTSKWWFICAHNCLYRGYLPVGCYIGAFLYFFPTPSPFPSGTQTRLAGTSRNWVRWFRERNLHLAIFRPWLRTLEGSDSHGCCFCHLVLNHERKTHLVLNEKTKHQLLGQAKIRPQSWYCGGLWNPAPVDRWFIRFIGFQPSGWWCNKSLPSTFLCRDAETCSKWENRWFDIPFSHLKIP